jgi:hypothetical protein
MADVEIYNSKQVYELHRGREAEEHIYQAKPISVILDYDSTLQFFLKARMMFTARPMTPFLKAHIT